MKWVWSRPKPLYLSGGLVTPPLGEPVWPKLGEPEPLPPIPERPHWTLADYVGIYLNRQFRWTNGPRPKIETLMHDRMGLPRETGIHHVRIEINDNSWGWDAAAGDEILGPFRLMVNIPELRGRPTKLERFLDQEIGL